MTRDRAVFARPADATAAPADGRDYAIEAGAEHLEGLAARLDVPAVRSLSGRIRLRPAPRGVALEGRVEASLVRVCVVTLSEIEERIAEDFTLRFERAVDDGAERELMIDEDSPEPLDGDFIDLADVLVQQTALAMDPYPRVPGASLGAAEFGQTVENSPFAVLKGAIAERGDEE